MNVLNIEKHPYRFQLMVYFVLPVVGLSGIWVFYLSLQEYVTGSLGGEIYWGWISGTLLLSASIFFIIRFLKKVPTVSVDLISRQFKIDKQTFSVEAIQQIDVFYSIGSGRFRLFEGSPGIKIRPEGMEEIILEDLYYRNMDELKWWLFQTIKGSSVAPPEINQVESDSLNKKEVEWIKTSLFEGKSLRYFFVIIAMLSLTAFQFYSSGSVLLSFGFLLMTLVSYISFGNQTTYFGFTGKYFLVRNYLSRAQSENWKLSDIKKIIINRRGGVSYLIIEFKDYSYRNFASLVLNDLSTDLLGKKLMEKKIEVLRMDNYPL